MEHNVDRKVFFNILQKLNLSCNINDFKDVYFEHVPKFKALMDQIDLDAYNLDYIQNRFIIVKPRYTPLTEITQLIFCPFNTKHYIRPEKCEEVIFEYYKKPRNSYLRKPINFSDRVKFETSTNEKDCIKGIMEPGLLNAIIIYMINNLLLGPTTMVVFGLKNYDSVWTSNDVLEYLQNHGLDKSNCKIASVVDIDFSSQEKGLPAKDFTGVIEIGVKKVPSVMKYINDVTQIEEEGLRESLNYVIKVNRNLKMLYDRDFLYHKELTNFLDINILSKFRINCFTDIPPSNKFSTFFMDKPFLVEWDSINKFINLLMTFNRV